MTSHKPLTIGFMGVGAMGRPMAERMLAHAPVVICDASEASRAAFSARAQVVASAKELGAAADIVFACLPSLKSYEATVLAQDGIAAGGRIRHFVHVGTTGPELVNDMNLALSARGITLLDAPVSGGPGRARAGELAVMASGPRELFVIAQPLIGYYASSITYLGEAPGQAQTLKLINNVLSAANLVIACEALILGVKAGLDPHQMLDVINHGTGANSATQTKIPDHLITRRFDYGGRLELVQKDLALFVQESAKLGLNLPLSTLIDATYQTAIAHEGMDGDMTEVIRYMERAAGVEVGP